MPDTMTPEQRHRCMAAIRGKDTRPEMVVRRWLWAQGYRYRLHVRRLPGTPDIVLHRYHTVINVNGCFWHGHEGCPHFTLPKTRTAYWRDKRAHNRQRDARNLDTLKHMGWYVITLWECDLAPAKRQRTLMGLSLALSTIYLKVAGARGHAEQQPLAAEPVKPYLPRR